MKDKELKLSEYIDSLNAEKKPAEHGKKIESAEMDKLFKTVRLVRSLKISAQPGENYGKKLAIEVSKRVSQKQGLMKEKRLWLTGAAAAIVIVLLAVFNFALPFGGTNMVYAMEQAYQGLKAYHGILEITEKNEDGQTTLQSRREVWVDKDGHYYIKELAGGQAGLITANNGTKKWQLRQDLKQAGVFPVFPDPYLFTFEMGREVNEVKNAIETKTNGDDTISGRKSSIIEVKPDGGVPYRLWIDKETSLPLKKESGIQNALQYTVEYTSIELIDAIPSELMTYKLPDGFTEINTDPEQLMDNIQEAQETAGFTPKTPAYVPSGYNLKNIAVGNTGKIMKLYYVNPDTKRNIIIMQGKAAVEFKPVSAAILGKVNNNDVEIQSPVRDNSGILTGGGAYAGMTGLTSMRWQENGFEYAVVGDTSLEELTLFIKAFTNSDLKLPSADPQQDIKPQVEVSADMQVEENEQKSVDAGHSPWRLDPVFTAQVFVSLQISPEGITGDYPIKYEELDVTKNTGDTAVVEVKNKNSPVARVYLKKLVRKDSTGIWTVVGYDPAGNC